MPRIPAAWLRELRFADRQHVRLFLRAFLVVSATFFGLWLTSLYLDALVDNRQQRVAMAEATRHARDLLANRLQTFVADLRVVSGSASLRRLVLGDDSARDAVAADFRRLAREKPAIAQLRYIDRRGEEIVRVDRLGNKVAVIGRAKLQNKADRYYFRQSIGLPASAIYVSPIDLNEEHGKIEVPWKPMLRLAVPIRQMDGRTSGVVIVNLNAADFIAQVDRMRPLHSDPIQLLNEDGYWLAGVEPSRLWGFMFHRNTTMATVAPEIWRRIASDPNGAFTRGGVHYVFDTLWPATYLASRRGVGAVRSGNVHWKIVGTVPGVSLADVWTIDRLPLTLVGFVVVAAICFAWSRMAVARRDAEDKRKKTEGELVRIERLASLGSLVAGVAHELNTPIGNAVTVASTLAENAERFGAGIASGQVKRSAMESHLKDLREGTTIMLRGLQRAAELIRNFKQIAVDQTSEQRRLFRVSDVVHDVVAALQPQFKHVNVALGTAINSTAELDSYPGPLGQVLLNLIANAHIHGFDEGAQGEIMVAARDLSPDEVEITIRDTGKGMSRDVLQRIFDPFFTTRLGQGGSGLGLSIVFNLVTGALGGTIHATSTPGQGTTMTLRLPRVAPAKEGTRRAYDVD